MIGSLFSFDGRIGRGSWWLVQVLAIPVLYILGASAVVGVVAVSPEQVEPSAPLGGAVIAVIALAFLLGIWLNLASTVKRYHDRDKSGFWTLIALVPLIGGIWQIIECGFCTGTDGDNSYGAPPGAGSASLSLERDVAHMAKGDGILAKLDDDYFKNYAAQAAARAEPLVQSTYARPTYNSGNSGNSTGTVFGRR
jgi:uncharacterized membrane protein YhaH (DUF805 family)